MASRLPGPVRVRVPLAWARACPRGLAAWGAGRPVGPGVREACFRKGQHFRGLDSWNSGRLSLLLAENYNRTTKDQTTESQSAQRLHDRGVYWQSPGLTILADCGLASPGSLSRALHPCLGSKARAPGCSARGRASGASSQFSRWWINLNMNHII